jgi:hypothetical protein
MGKQSEPGSLVIEITAEELDARIAAASRAGAEAAIAAMMAQGRPAPATPPPSLADQDSAYMRSLKELHGRPAMTEPELIACKSPETDATFFARCDATGRVLDLVDYREPDGHDRYEDEDGGRMPHGAPIRNANGAYEQSFLQHRYETYRLADLRMYVGKNLMKKYPHIVVRDAEIAAE